MRNKAGSCELGRKNRKGLSISYALNVQLCMSLQLIDESRTEADIIVSFFICHTTQHYKEKILLTTENKLGRVIHKISKFFP